MVPVSLPHQLTKVRNIVSDIYETVPTQLLYGPKLGRLCHEETFSMVQQAWKPPAEFQG